MLSPQTPFDWAHAFLKTQAHRRKFVSMVKTHQQKRVGPTNYTFAVFKKITGELVGEVSMVDASRGGSMSASCGYLIFNNHWRQGYGLEALRGLIDIAFNKLALHRLEAYIEVKNRGSQKLAKMAEFRKEGIAKKRLFFKGAWNDVFVYALTCEDIGIKNVRPITYSIPNG